MQPNYEFRRQSAKQKVILFGVRGIVLVMIGFTIVALADQKAPDLGDTLNAIGSVFTAIWIHSNLLQVKVEIQELFVPPFNTLNGAEYMLIGFVCFMAAFFL